MKENNSVLIAGCGYVGSALAEKLTNLGYKVDGIRRFMKESSNSFNPIYQDLTQPFKLFKRYSHVFYLTSAGSYDANSYDRAYRLGVVNLLDALVPFPKPELFVFVSSTSVYPQHDGEWIDEQSLISSDGFARQALLSGEKLVIESGIPSLVVRFSGIYGPGRMRFKEEILLQQRGLVEPPFYTNRIHRDDCVGALVHLMKNGKAGETYIASDCEPSLHNDVVKWLCEQARIEPLSSSPSNPALSIHRGNKRCSNKKLIESGYEFIHPTFKSGYV